MVNITSRNQIQLGGDASDSNDYYIGYTVVFTRLDKASGRKVQQKGRIVDYDGATRIATIDNIWHPDIIPGPETAEKIDTYEIVRTYGDNRVSINPAMQSMDYISSDRYGRGLNPIKDLNLPSWLEAARTCDTRSDVTVQLVTGTANVGDVYKYPATGPILFRGKVKSKNGAYTRFTEVIGKVSNLWNSWKSFPVDSIVYYEDRQYRSTVAGTKGSVPPTHTSGTVNGLEYITGNLVLTRVSGSGSVTLPLVKDGNPVRSVINGIRSTGYSLYDSDGIDYWRYIGWNNHDQREVTQFQTNIQVDTSLPMFDNMNSFLQHFGGLLRYNNGQYYLEVEQGEEGISISNDPRRITSDDIVGKIRLTDEGIRNSFNSLTVAYADPANKFEARNISFFNSEYLKSDRNVPRKGSMSIPGVTNYYNARLLADKYLIKSRYNLSVSFNMSPKGALLVAGRVIEIPYARYGWTGKKFRITDLTHNTDCSVDIVAEEYDDAFYYVKAVRMPPSTGLSTNTSGTSVASPTNVTASNEVNGRENTSGIELNWTNAEGLAAGSVYTEIHAGPSTEFQLHVVQIANGSLITTHIDHDLNVGDRITVNVKTDGFTADTYYVKSIPNPDELTLSLTPDGEVISTFTNGAKQIGAIPIYTTTLIGTVAYPESRYFDAYSGGGTDRVEKYYWLRYRIE